MKRLAVILIASVMTLVAAKADNKHIEYKQTYNYKQGVELFNNEDYAGALNYLHKETSNHPDNGYAYYWMTKSYALQSNYSESLTYAEKMIKHLSEDAYWLSHAYMLRGNIYQDLGEISKAEKDYTKAIDVADISLIPYERRARFYSDIDKTELSNNDYKKVLEINPGKIEAYAGLAKNAMKGDHFKEAVDYCNKAMKFESDNLELHNLLADAYTGLGKYDKAVSELFYVMKRDISHISNKTNDCLLDSAYNIVELHLKANMRIEPNNPLWLFYASTIYKDKGNYEEAIIQLGKLYDISPSPIYHTEVAECYENMRNFKAALSEIDQSAELESDNIDLSLKKIGIYTEMGEKELAIALCDSLIEANPEMTELYYTKGWTCLDFGMMDEAFENFETLYASLNDETWVRYIYGRMLNERGKTSEAKAIFEDIIETESQKTQEDEAHLMYTHVMLGNYDEAIELLNKMLRTKLKENAYEAACAYALMGDKDKSMEYLKIALDKGYNKFHHIRNDIDLKTIQGTAEFDALLSEYESRWADRIGSDKAEVETENEVQVSEIPFTRENGICKVKCTLNGLPLYFVFDTGASDVSISNIEASFMIKNEYISQRDIIGKQRYSDANGDISVGTVINIAEVRFGDLQLSNVRASVVNNQKAPLLLGQSILSKLGKIEIDNDRKVIRITK